MSETNMRPEDFIDIAVSRNPNYWDELTLHLRWKNGLLEQASMRHFEDGQIQFV